MEDQMNRRHVIAGTAMAAGTLALPALAQDDIARSLLQRFAATLSSHDIVAFAATYFGIAPTHRPLRFTSRDIFSVRNGLIA
jgi:hypothetical protein